MAMTPETRITHRCVTARRILRYATLAYLLTSSAALSQDLERSPHRDVMSPRGGERLSDRDTTTFQDGTQRFDELGLYNRLEKYERAVYEGFRYLMNDHQKRQYLGLPTRMERDEWIERFWRMLDATPTTKMNERKIEHERRVKAARKRYPREGFPCWDRRGETLIRFGEPDWIEEIPPQLTDAESNFQYFWRKMPGEVWHYFRLEMVVPFEEVNLNGECTYYMALKTVDRQWAATTEENIYNSELFSYLTESFAYSPSNVYELSFASSDELITFYSHIENNRYFHTIDTDREPLECYFDLTSFDGGGGKLRSEINLEIPTRELRFDKKQDKECSRFQVRVAAFDMEMKEVESFSEIVDLELPATESPMSDRLIPAQFILTLDPGYYRFGLEVKDFKSKKHGAYWMSRNVEPLGAGLGMSDIQFASSITPAGERRAFIKGPLRVVPHPLHAYRKRETVKCYFEIYGLDTDSEDFAFYSVEYSIAPRERRRWGPVLKDEGTAISSRFETSAYGSTQREHIEIDTGELWEGSFRLRIRILDRRTREAIEKVARFSVID